MVDKPPAALVFLRNQMASDTERLPDTLARAASELTNLGVAGVLELRLLAAQGAGAVETYRVAVSSDGAVVTGKDGPAPTVVAEAPADVVRGILDGTVSPQQAYLEGAVTLAGNVDLARRIIVRLAAAGAARSVCPSIIDEAYFAIGGLLKVRGSGFTPFSTVQLLFDYADDTPDWQATAQTDVDGFFEIGQFNIPCGDREGDPAVGVIVTAIDTVTRQSTTQSFLTPC